MKKNAARPVPIIDKTTMLGTCDQSTLNGTLNANINPKANPPETNEVI